MRKVISLLIFVFFINTSWSQSFLKGIQRQISKVNRVAKLQKKYIKAVEKNKQDYANNLYSSIKLVPQAGTIDADKLVEFKNATSVETFTLLENYLLIGKLLYSANELFLSSSRLENNVGYLKASVESNDMNFKRLTVTNINSSWIDVKTIQLAIQAMLKEHPNKDVTQKSRLFFSEIFLFINRIDEKCFSRKVTKSTLDHTKKITNYLRELQSCVKSEDLLNSSAELTRKLQEVFIQKYQVLNTQAEKQLYLLDQH